MENKIQRVLNDPDAMSAVLNLARSLGGSGSSGQSEPEQEPVPSPEEPLETEMPDGAGLAGLSDLLGSIDPAMMGKLMGLLGEYTRTDDRRTAFLSALKPYLRDERAAKVDRAGQLVRIARTASKALEGWNDK